MRILPKATAAVAFLGLFAGCVTMSEHEALMKAYDAQRAHAASIQATNDRLSVQNEGLVMEKEALSALLKKRQAELELTVAQLKAKDKAWGAEIDKRTGAISREYQDKLAAMAAQKSNGFEYDAEKNKLTLEAGVFFKSGSDEVLTAAKKTILEVCQALKGTDVGIHIVGHTDNEPVVKSKERYPRGNFQLSGERALSVLLEMRDKGSIAARRLSYEGRGDTTPVADNGTAAGRAKNRRVEIFIREG